MYNKKEVEINISDRNFKIDTLNNIVEVERFLGRSIEVQIRINGLHDADFEQMAFKSLYLANASGGLTPSFTDPNQHPLSFIMT